MTRITVASDAPYDVLVGRGLLGELPALLGSDVQRVLVVHPKALHSMAEGVRADLAAGGLETFSAEVPDGEQAKTAQVAASLWGVLGQAGLTRSDAVVGVGGGAVTDLAGFVAATWLRGVRAVQVPTTLLAMVDAAVGGKTGINTAEGKNLVGSFHPPAGVLCDLATLETLPRKDFVAGLAEVVKCGFIADPVILELIESDPEAATQWDGPMTRELVERSIRIKADVVGQDLREAGLREILNYGHTFGHRTLALPDHYDFNSWSRNGYEGYTLICTEKDALKLWPLEPDALAVPLLLTPEPAFLTQLDARLDRLLAIQP